LDAEASPELHLAPNNSNWITCSVDYRQRISPCGVTRWPYQHGSLGAVYHPEARGVVAINLAQENGRTVISQHSRVCRRGDTVLGGKRVRVGRQPCPEPKQGYGQESQRDSKPLTSHELVGPIIPRFKPMQAD
jgi:hypothetical protein